jgi:hypothetical protein
MICVSYLEYLRHFCLKSMFDPSVGHDAPEVSLKVHTLGLDPVNPDFHLGQPIHNLLIHADSGHARLGLSLVTLVGTSGLRNEEFVNVSSHRDAMLAQESHLGADFFVLRDDFLVDTGTQCKRINTYGLTETPPLKLETARVQHYQAASAQAHPHHAQ